MNPVTKAADVTMAPTGAGGAQREPSMEEILASIRRIIEDNDAPKKPDEAAAPPANSVDFEVERVAKASIEVDAFRTELQSPPRPGKPISLAEVQAQVLDETPAAPTEETDAFPVLTAGNDIGVAPATPEEQVRPTAQVEPVVVKPEPAAPANHEFVAQRPAIISEHAGRQVAASFGELSEAFAQRSKKTFDDMAERMLRPMLQDWLDNNLPTLVERLVREEIERVARGAQ